MGRGIQPIKRLHGARTVADQAVEQMLEGERQMDGDQRRSSAQRLESGRDSASVNGAPVTARTV